METEAVKQREITSDARTAQMPKVNSTSTCLLCDDCPDELEALHLLQHYKAANGEAIDSAVLDPSFAALLSGAGVTLEDDLLSPLKTYFASNANPSEKELTKISESVSIPVDVVRKWFAKMNSGTVVGKYHNLATAVSMKTETTNSSSEDASNQNGDAEEDSSQQKASSQSGSAFLSDSSLNTGDLVDVKSESEIAALEIFTPTTPPAKQQELLLNLTGLRKEQLEGRSISVTTPQIGRHVNIDTAQLRTLATIAGQGDVRCLTAINTTMNCPILIPELAYTTITSFSNATGEKTIVLNVHKQEKRLDSSSDGVSTVEEQNDSDSTALMEKQQLEKSGAYKCDICSKVFQKYYMLVRHKFEHLGSSWFSHDVSSVEEKKDSAAVMKEQQLEKSSVYPCDICSKVFHNFFTLVRHKYEHTGKRPH
ncbi:zinc finger E-box-binding homeobox 1-like [Cottoperca gobio]|uniref:Zinc finger E-box-binding homeobox 1-like n=1 Tax=Cottoperca gobio TaxID=56716 RepID=A0A6J2RKK1_COTGO|nr:zinc finger E-box-binding homeobox 1-like [Cottoperca gobio]